MSVLVASWRVLTQERARPARLRAWPHAWWLAVATVCFGAFMGQLDASIVTLTYRPLRTGFDTSLAAVQWVSLAYLLTLAAFLIPVGRLADARGRKLLYLYGFVVFTASSAACGLAPTLGMLIAFRVVQGIGAAMLQANSVALVVTSAPEGKTRTALGVQAAAQAVGLALGPTVGGLLVSTWGWRWVFGINVPVGVIAVVAGVFLLPRTRTFTPTSGRDGSGLALLAVATTSGLLGLSAASGLGLPGWAPVALLCVAAGAAVGFVVRERRASAPMLDLALLRARTVSTGLAGALAGYLVLFGPLVLVPIVLTGAGLTELHAGLVLTALPAGFALAATSGERLLPRSWTDRPRAMVGALLCVVALAAMAVAPLTPGWLVASLAALGVALGLFTPANNSLVMRAIPTRTAGTGGGLLNMTRGLGTALGVALVTLALHVRPAGTGLLDGPRTAVLVLLAAAVALLASARMTPRTDDVAHEPAPVADHLV
ncbi:MFS transporter [Cellulomonas sp. P24]|uniref:MFS transporter n=1 Tax=Cellulomonas sp. P24 TaxID=2885206 RepID=UPI00216AF412|nr:MFS transporter [Cellulomonas sp. P24]MCR6491887.1 MFS transporter [Cellulomonas sp. P24]